MVTMAKYTQRHGVICWLLLFALVNWANATQYFMDRQCGNTISAGISAGNLVSQIGSNYKNNVDCTVTISASFGRQILLTFDRMNIQPDCGDKLQVYDGSSTASPQIGGDICGAATPAAITSTSSTITVRLTSDSTGLYMYSGFDMPFTSFSASFGFCDDGEFKCANDRCIDSSLQSNGYDNCGDNSDETSLCGSGKFQCGNDLCIDSGLQNDGTDDCGDNSDELLHDFDINIDGAINTAAGLAVGIIVAIIIGCIAVFVLIVVGCACMCYHCCCKTQHPPYSLVVAHTTQQQPNVAMQQAGQPAPYGQPPPYGKPAPYGHPSA